MAPRRRTRFAGRGPHDRGPGVVHVGLGLGQRHALTADADLVDVGGVGGTLALTQYSFTRNAQALAAESVSGAQRLFSILENREISKMTAVSEALLLNSQVRDAFAAKRPSAPPGIA